MPGNAQHRLGGVGEQIVEVGGRLFEHTTPPRTVGAEFIGGPVDRSVHDAGRTVVERMDTVDLGLQPGEAFGRQVEIGHDR